MNTVHPLPSCFSKIHFNIILTSMPRSSKQTPSFSFSYHRPVRSSVGCVPHTPPISSSIVWSP
jgi:hypothetical protein